VYLEESAVDMRIDTLSEMDDVPAHCTRCNSTLEKIYCRSEDSEINEGDFDLLVFTCPRCKRMFAFWVVSPRVSFGEADDWENTEPTENQPLSLDKKEKKRILRNRMEKYERAISAQDAKQIELYRIIQQAP
jgi:hypothetical protein